MSVPHWLLSVRILVLTIAIVAVDQLVKGFVVGSLALGASRPVVHGLLDLSYQQNPGVAFSALLHASAYVLIALNLLVLGLFVTFMLPRAHTRGGWVALSLVCGGAVGNLIDRIRLHYVIDYLNFHFWPVFNIADASIVIGVGLLMLTSLFSHRATTPSTGGDHS